MIIVRERDNARVTHAVANKIFIFRLSSLFRMRKISLKSCQHKSSTKIFYCQIEHPKRTRHQTRVYCLTAFNELRLLRFSLFLYSLAYISNIHHTYFCLRTGISLNFSSTMLFSQNSLTVWYVVCCKPQKNLIKKR